MTTLPNDVLEDIHYWVVHGFYNRDAVFDDILSSHPQLFGITNDECAVEDVDSETMATLREAIERAFAETERTTEQNLLMRARRIRARGAHLASSPRL